MRPCEGPPGHKGPPGHHHGPHGSKGPPGKAGVPGSRGDPGPAVVDNRRMTERPVSWTSLGCALALNVLMVLASIAYLISSTGKGRAKAPGEAVADADGDEGYNEGEDDYQYAEGEDAQGDEVMPTEGGEEGVEVEEEAVAASLR